MTLERSEVEKERHRRIRLLMAAYAYEIVNRPIISDEEFDKLAYEVDLNISTENEKMDRWFKENFRPYTGQWIHSLPTEERVRINQIYNTIFAPVVTKINHEIHGQRTPWLSDEVNQIKAVYDAALEKALIPEFVDESYFENRRPKNENRS